MYFYTNCLSRFLGQKNFLTRSDCEYPCVNSVQECPEGGISHLTALRENSISTGCDASVKLAHFYSKGKQEAWGLKSPKQSGLVELAHDIEIFSSILATTLKKSMEVQHHWALCADYSGGTCEAQKFQWNSHVGHVTINEIMADTIETTRYEVLVYRLSAI